MELTRVTLTLFHLIKTREMLEVWGKVVEWVYHAYSSSNCYNICCESCTVGKNIPALILKSWIPAQETQYSVLSHFMRTWIILLKTELERELWFFFFLRQRATSESICRYAQLLTLTSQNTVRAAFSYSAWFSSLPNPEIPKLSQEAKSSTDSSDVSSSLDVLNTPVGSAQIKFIDTDPTSKLKNAEQFA